MIAEKIDHDHNFSDCPECMGTGRISAQNCGSCDGTGTIIVHSHRHAHGGSVHDHPHSHMHPHRPGDDTAHRHGHHKTAP